MVLLSSQKGTHPIMMTVLFERLTTAPDLDTVTPEQLAKRKKANQARLNAQKSTGPTSEQGKAKSALNARRHGYSGATAVIEDEDLPAFNAHLDSYFASFAPQTQAECDTIRRAAIAMWRSDRLTSIETGILDIETNHAATMVDAALTGYELHHKLAYSFMQQTATEGQTALALCLRYLTAANRDFDRAVRTFYLMKDNRLTDAERQMHEPAESATVTEAQATAAEEAATIHIVKKAQQKSPTPNEPTLPAQSTPDSRIGEGGRSESSEGVLGSKPKSM
jgi:hypothetical protein